MEGALFMLGTVVVEGGLVSLLMWVITASERDARREEEARARLAKLEAEEEKLRKAA